MWLCPSRQLVHKYRSPDDKVWKSTSGCMSIQASVVSVIIRVHLPLLTSTKYKSIRFCSRLRAIAHNTPSRTHPKRGINTLGLFDSGRSSLLPVPAVIHLILRSEEHTSELQA